ncbi:MAG: DUF1540 domain-containing protein [Firmicutes bacterium]|jgi:hypothetical protein|nr:DUF1540 domain-containing protein [Bacillota bacterium]
MTDIYCGVEECKWNKEGHCSRDVTRVDSNTPYATATEVVNCMSFTLPDEGE